MPNCSSWNCAFFHSGGRAHDRFKVALADFLEVLEAGNDFFGHGVAHGAEDGLQFFLNVGAGQPLQADLGEARRLEGDVVQDPFHRLAVLAKRHAGIEHARVQRADG